MECPPLLEPRPSAIRDTTRKRMIGVGDELVSFIPASIHPSSQPASQPSIHPAEKELEGGRHSDSRLIGVFGTHSTPSRSRAPREERSMQTNRTGSDNCKLRENRKHCCLPSRGTGKLAGVVPGHGRTHHTRNPYKPSRLAVASSPSFQEPAKRNLAP
ncbi:hypothetical protein Mp_1g15650 [Marchantia polymorpha subsp. ruderalis]|uniref:Uncharacterized protein n=2 Tax=Marchantia polymorpha TaxID=3197 RepID=A0AAF6AQJ2_MARPO|nr:hypothetical protein MARPO_0033s0096 [Marchantia polymorpha]BBM98712.1 hypothetical protein Mp_1g15650 [Marchantia polymorpha subsp. ruderalis]|eukprot:PTQ41694.1 hypothetical protein MARPO_0033s0096 [Marchantia polymorpha]